MDSLTFLQSATKTKPQPIYVLHGDEHFLKRRVMAALRKFVLGLDESFSSSNYDGEKASWAEIHDELATVPFLGSHRLIMVDRAEPFITRERSRLEKYFAEPSKTGVLVLEVQSWPANTKLAKLLPEAAAIACKAPPSHKLPEWCIQWCADQYGKALSASAARLLVDLVGADMGLLDQEIAKLAVYVGSNSRIDAAEVDQLVGQSRAENTWKIFDLIGAGQTGEALKLLARLLDQGEEPLRLLGAFSMQLRRLAQAARLHSQGESVSEALEHAGVPPFGRKSAEQQLRHLGRRRLDWLYDGLLETDLGLKGSSQLPPRILLERFVVQLARKRSSELKV